MHHQDRCITLLQVYYQLTSWIHYSTFGFNKFLGQIGQGSNIFCSSPKCNYCETIYFFYINCCVYFLLLCSIVHLWDFWLFCQHTNVLLDLEINFIHHSNYFAKFFLIYFYYCVICTHCYTALLDGWYFFFGCFIVFFLTTDQR